MSAGRSWWRPLPAVRPTTVRSSSRAPSAFWPPRSRFSRAQREAKLSALGVISAVHQPDGIVGDLGGGSLELVDISGKRVSRGVSLPLGGLALAGHVAQVDQARRAASSRDELDGLHALKAGRGRTFYAVGGTWRALARLHISQTDYPLRVMHGYAIPADEALAFALRVKRMTPGRALPDIEAVADARRPLLAYAALVLEHIIRIAKPKTIMISTFGVREGLLFSKLPAREQARDGLLAAAHDLNVLRSRSPKHAEELFDWTEPFRQGGRLSSRRRRSAAGATPPACSPISAGARIPTIAASSRST